MNEVGIIGLDLAKNVVRAPLLRAQRLQFMAEQPPCIVAMQACASAHHWGWAINDLGHEVRPIPPACVKPFVKRQTNDMPDAEASAEATSRPTLCRTFMAKRFIPHRRDKAFID